MAEVQEPIGVDSVADVEKDETAPDNQESRGDLLVHKD